MLLKGQKRLNLNIWFTFRTSLHLLCSSLSFHKLQGLFCIQISSIIIRAFVVASGRNGTQTTISNRRWFTDLPHSKGRSGSSVGTINPGPKCCHPHAHRLSFPSLLLQVGSQCAREAGCQQPQNRFFQHCESSLPCPLPRK